MTSRAATALTLGLVLAACAWWPGSTAASSKLLVLSALGLLVVAPALPRWWADRARLSGAGAAWCLAGHWATQTVTSGSPSGAAQAALIVASLLLLLRLARLDREARVAVAQATSLGVALVTSTVLGVQLALGARGLALHGGHGNPNWAGVVLALSAPGAVAFAGRAGRGAQLAVGVLVGAALALTWARVAWLAIAVGALAGALLARRARPRRPGARAPWLALGLGVALCLASVTLVRRVAPTTQPWSQALAGRVFIWRVSADVALARAPFGAGTGSFAAEYLSEQGRALAPLSPAAAARRFSNATSAHSEYLDAAVERGAPGVALYLGVLLLALIGLVRAAAWDGAATVITLAVASTAESALSLPAVVIVLVPWLAVASAETPRLSLPEHLVALVTIVLTAASLPGSLGRWRSERAVSGSLDAGPVERFAALDRAVRLSPTNGEAWLERGLLAQQVGASEAAVADLTLSYELLPNVGTLIALGNVALANGRPGAAATRYEQALALHPGSLRAHAGLALARVRLGSLDSARAHLSAAREIAPGTPELDLVASELAERAAE